MKFLLLIHNNAEALQAFTDEQLTEMAGGRAQVAATARELRNSGELVSILNLGEPTGATEVRYADGTPVVSDRPLLETKEYLAGALVLECDSIERVVELTARIPLVEFRRIEIRPVIATETDFYSELLE